MSYRVNEWNVEFDPRTREYFYECPDCGRNEKDGCEETCSRFIPKNIINITDNGNTMSKIGDLHVWHIPQIPMEPFIVPVSCVEEAVKILHVLADYDLFQLKTNIKPDYSNAQGLCRCEEIEGKLEWVDWYDEETEEYDPEIYIENKKKGDNHGLA